MLKPFVEGEGTLLVMHEGTVPIDAAPGSLVGTLT